MIAVRCPLVRLSLRTRNAYDVAGAVLASPRSGVYAGGQPRPGACSAQATRFLSHFIFSDQVPGVHSALIAMRRRRIHACIHISHKRIRVERLSRPIQSPADDVRSDSSCSELSPMTPSSRLIIAPADWLDSPRYACSRDRQAFQFL